MNGIRLLGLSLCTSLALGISEVYCSEPPPVEANEQACYREKVTTSPSKPPVRNLTLPVALISHHCALEQCEQADDEVSCDQANTVARPRNDCPITEEELDAIFEANAALPCAPSPSDCLQEGRISLASSSATSRKSALSPKQEIAELRVLNAELVARLEMTQAMMELQNYYTDQIVLLERQNAKLAAEAAELRIKNEVQEQMTACLIERTELAGKLSAAHDWISSRTAYEASLPIQVHPTAAIVANPSYDETIADIREDLSNLRRQLPLIKRSPVPFAVSSSIKPDYSSVPSKSSSREE